MIFPLLVSEFVRCPEEMRWGREMKTSMRTSIVSGGKKEKRRSPAMPKSDEGGEGIFVPLPRTGILPYTDQKKLGEEGGI